MKLPLFLLFLTFSSPTWAEEPIENSTMRSPEQPTEKESLLKHLEIEAEQKYQNESIFKDSRKQKYMDRAKKLNTLTLQALVDDISVTKMNEHQLKSLKKVITDRIKIEDELTGFLWGGIKSGKLIEDLKNLQEKVSKELATQRIKEEQEANNRAAARIQQPLDKTKSINASSFISTVDAIQSPQSESVPTQKTTPSNIHQQITLLESQLKIITDKRPQTPGLRQEAITVKESLTSAYRKLLDATNSEWYDAIAKLKTIRSKLSDPIIDNNNDQRNLIENEISAAEKEYAKFELLIQTKERLISNLTQEQLRQKDSLDQAKNKLDELSTQKEYQTDAIGKKIDSIKILTKSLQMTNIKLEAAKTEKKSLEDQMLEAQEQKSSAHIKLKNLPTKKFFDSLIKEEKDLSQQEFSIRTEKLHLETKIDSLKKGTNFSTVGKDPQAEQKSPFLTNSGKVSAKSALAHARAAKA